MTPAVVHYGSAAKCNDRRQMVLAKAFEEHPERFVNGLPKVLELPEAVWINPPNPQKTSDTEYSITIISDSKASVS